MIAKAFNYEQQSFQFAIIIECWGMECEMCTKSILGPIFSDGFGNGNCYCYTTHWARHRSITLCWTDRNYHLTNRETTETWPHNSKQERKELTFPVFVSSTDDRNITEFRRPPILVAHIWLVNHSFILQYWYVHQFEVFSMHFSAVKQEWIGSI